MGDVEETNFMESVENGDNWTSHVDRLITLSST